MRFLFFFSQEFSEKGKEEEENYLSFKFKIMRK